MTHENRTLKDLLGASAHGMMHKLQKPPTWANGRRRNRRSRRIFLTEMGLVMKK
jgi:hypothetical protein